MTTALDIITRAGRSLAILPGEEAFNASDADDALSMLNDLLFNFPARGIAYTHVALALADAVNFPPLHIRSIVLLLAGEIAGDYGVEVSAAMQADMARAENQLQAAYPVGTADSTALGVCYQAFRRLRLSVDGEGKAHPSLNWSFVTATSSADALRVLNDMMFGLPARGIVYTHSTLAASDPVPIGSGNLRNLVLLLVKEFGFHFAVTLDPKLEVEIVRAEQQLQAAFPPTMDATVLGLINQALNRLRVFAGNEGGAAMPWYFVSATSATAAVRTFNDMMHGLGTRGIKYAHTTLASGATVNLPDEQIRNLILLLVKEFANIYAVALPAQAMVEINRAEGALQAAYWIQPPAQTDPLLRPPSRSFDMTRGQ